MNAPPRSFAGLALQSERGYRLGGIQKRIGTVIDSLGRGKPDALTTGGDQIFYCGSFWLGKAVEQDRGRGGPSRRRAGPGQSSQSAAVQIGRRKFDCPMAKDLLQIDLLDRLAGDQNPA